MAKLEDTAAFFRLLSSYGVPRRIINTLISNYPVSLPEPYSLNHTPSELCQNKWIYLYGPTGTGKSTHAAYLMSVFLRARARLGEARLDIKRACDDDTYVARGGALQDQVCYRYVRVTELLHAMKEDFNSGSHYGQHLFNCCRRAAILVLDDLTSQLSQWELAQLDYLIDRRYGDELKTIITSNHSLERLKRVLGSERIPGRIGEVAHMKKMKRTYR